MDKKIKNELEAAKAELEDIKKDVTWNKIIIIIIILFLLLLAALA